jgi:asparagine synthase (glutamine-hydrolysing)|tara:strand:+ start:2748 stop:4574 length:1827 start_codon:yes stop_codon:yes gene_type:complete
MCGIAGLINCDGGPVDPYAVKKMCKLIKHRGPDDHGVWSGDSVVLGHQRLSIIDISDRGHNPMPNEDETVWIVFNGEIYNYKELRKDLLMRGHRFRSEADTEVIIHLYEEYGHDCIEMLNGMFAFAIYDKCPTLNPKRSTLLLARDRFGVKPLYYIFLNKTLAFASEVKAFLALSEFKVRADFFALAEHFTFQNTFGSRCFFKDVKLLQAGHYMEFNDGHVGNKKYWDLYLQPRNNLSLKQWTEGLRGYFESSVARQIMSDVPLGTYLSGGMDTGAISTIATRFIPGMHTFTCGFDLPDQASEQEKYFDEREESRRLANYLCTEHHELELGADAMLPAAPFVVWHLDEPRIGISYQIYYTAKMISRYVKVVLSGVGGDELFAGYPWRYEPIVNIPDKDFYDAYYSLCIRFYNDEWKKGFFTDEVNQELSDFSTFDSFRNVFNDANDLDSLHKALYFDFKTFLNALLLVEDKLTMAYSVEARVPFLDNELVDYIARMPSDIKLSGGEGKVVLKEALRGLLPNETISRRKQGFTPPDQTWYSGSLNSIRDFILGSRALDRGYFQPKALEKIMDDHLQNRQNNRFLIWSLICFEWWNRLFVDLEPLPETTK